MSEYTPTGDAVSRVRDKGSGHKFTVPTSVAENTDGLEILDEPALDPGGAFLPQEYAEPKTAKKTSSSGKES